jgi:hypothetical protein
MSIHDLASTAVVPPTIIMDPEAAVSAPSKANLEAIRRALERADVEFIADGVKLTKGR